MHYAVIVSVMSKTILVYQNLHLVGEPTPANIRVDQSHDPVEVGIIAEHIQSFSLAPVYSAKQLREIQRRSIRRKLASRSPSTKIKRKVFALSHQLLDEEANEHLSETER